MSVEKIVEITGVKYLQPKDFIPIFGVYNFASRASELFPIYDSISVISVISRVSIIAMYNAVIVSNLGSLTESLFK